MHRSKIWGVVIDCHDIEAGVRFWSGALGATVGNRGDPYIRLEGGSSPLPILLQRVSEEKQAKSRVHLDIEADDVTAEVERLEKLGARRREQVERWWVMEDPCGNEFCVIPAASPNFLESAHAWEA